MIKIIYNEAETRDLGRQIASVLQSGDVIELIGDVGSGKTTLVKGIAEGLGIKENIQSPSYTISARYKVNDDLQLVHYDFYRLNDAGLMSHELEEIVGKPGFITIIEWAHVVEDVLPIDRLTINIVSPDVNVRRMIIESHGFRSMELAKKL